MNLFFIIIIRQHSFEKSLGGDNFTKDLKPLHSFLVVGAPYFRYTVTTIRRNATLVDKNHWRDGNIEYLPSQRLTVLICCQRTCHECREELLDICVGRILNMEMQIWYHREYKGTLAGKLVKVKNVMRVRVFLPFFNITLFILE